MELYQLPQGQIIIAHLDKKLSIGLLKLDPNQALPKHNRPVKEELVQVSGTCIMSLINRDNFIKDVVLKEGDKLVIPANKYHVHSNRTSEVAITLWKFEGDITEIIENIRKNYKNIL